MTYTKAGKETAYQHALEHAGEIDNLNADGVFGEVVDYVKNVAMPNLTDNDVLDVTAKAIRIERGRRKNANASRIPSIYLGSGEQGKQRHAAAVAMAASEGYMWGGKGSVGGWFVAQVDQWIEETGFE